MKPFSLARGDAAAVSLASEGRPAPPAPVIGNLPPPITGQAAITRAVAEALVAAGPAPRHSLSPGHARGPLRHPVRAARAMVAAAGMVAARLQGARFAYVACDGGLGRLHLAPLLALARLLGLRLRLHHHSWAYLDRPDALMRLLLALGGPALGHVFLSPGMRVGFRAAYGGDGRRDLVISNAVFLRPPEMPGTIPRRAPRGPEPGARIASREDGGPPPRDRAAGVEEGPVAPRHAAPHHPQGAIGSGRPPLDPAARLLRVGLLANLDRAKGLHEMLALSDALRDRGLPVEVRLAGPVRDPRDRAALAAALRRVEAEALTAGLAPRLAWTGGAVDGEAKAAFYAGLDLFLLPTTHVDEAEPAVIWEAAFAGVPSLAWGRGAIPEQVGPGCALDPARAFRPWAISRVEAFLADPTSLAEAGVRARAHAEARARAGARALAILLAERERA